jgi:hypothetical protein
MNYDTMVRNDLWINESEIFERYEIGVTAHSREYGSASKRMQNEICS